MMRVKIEGFERVEARLRKVAYGNKLPLLKGIGLLMEEQTRKRFDAKSAPDGSKWKAWSESTKRYVSKHGGAMLRSTDGTLYNRISSEVQGNKIVVGVDLKYAAIHQFGGKAGKGKKATIPARPYLGIGQKDAREIVSLVEDWLERQGP